MMELHEMYATLTAKRPDLKAGVDWFHDHGWVTDQDSAYINNTPENHVAALIRVKWEDALPDLFLYHSNGSGSWHVADFDNCDLWQSIASGESAIEALYHFHMEQGS